jgi:hypothetical protein
VVYHTLVKPDNQITNYLTQYSGVTKEMLENVTTRYVVTSVEPMQKFKYLYTGLRIQTILMRIPIQPLKKPDPDPSLCKILHTVGVFKFYLWIWIYRDPKLFLRDPNQKLAEGQRKKLKYRTVLENRYRFR